MNLRKKNKILKNNLKALAAYQKKKTFLKHLPSYLWIEPTNFCNLHCIMCPTGAGKVHVEKGYMKLGLFQSIIDEIHPYTSTVILAMGGESFLHPDLMDMIKYADLQQVKVALNTNATLLDMERAKKLLNSGVSYISFAFDGFNRDMYQKARRGADFQKTLDNILAFLQMKKERRQKKPYTVLSMLKLDVGEYTEEEKVEFLKQFENLIDDIHLREVNSWGSLFKNTKEFNYVEFSGRSFPCGRLWNTLGITWDGDVVPCIYNMNHDYIVGNINHIPLKELWNSSKLVRLRQAMLDGSYLELSPICENCTFVGTPKILGIPAGLRATFIDAVANFLGYRIEKKAIRFANRIRKGSFASQHIRK